MKLIYDGREIETGGGGLTQKEADGRYMGRLGRMAELGENVEIGAYIDESGSLAALQIIDGKIYVSREEKEAPDGPPHKQYTFSVDDTGAYMEAFGEEAFSSISVDETGIHLVYRDPSKIEEDLYVSVGENGLDVGKCAEPTADTMPATKGYVDRAISESGASVPGDGNPLGTVISFMGKKAPKGYLVCDGALYSVNDYPALAAFFSEQFGAANHFGGDGETTFEVPDLRNQFLRGFHGDSPEKLSGEIGALQKGTEIPYLYSARNESGLGGVIYPIPTENYTSQLKNPDFQTGKPPTYAGIWPSSTSNNTNIITSYGVRPVNMAVLFCIKAF